ncbi:MAG: FtsH protease activity modulator HflK [Pseudomonadota bacterium]
MALNDPQWGKKRNDGPPDLEEIFSKFNQKLAGLFGGGGGDPSSGGSNLKQWGGGVGVVILLALLIWIASGFYIVDEGRRGVVMRFGKYTETTAPGPHWRLPKPFETVEVVNVSSVRTVEIGHRNMARTKVPQEALMLTDDENIIDLQFAVQYTLKSPEDFLFNNRNFRADNEEAEKEVVRQVAETAIREVVGKNKMDFVLYEGRAEIAVRAQQLMQAILDRYKTGIAISKVTMQNAQPPEQVQAAFDDAVKAGQDRERQKNEGQAYANDVVPRARGLASRLIEESNGYRQRVIAQAEGDASRFKQVLVEYDKAPGVTRERLYLDMMQQVLSNTTKIVNDGKGGSNLLYLPLDKLMQMNPSSTQPQAGSSDPIAAVRPTPEPQVNAEVPPVHSREALRARERDSR